MATDIYALRGMIFDAAAKLETAVGAFLPKPRCASSSGLKRWAVLRTVHYWYMGNWLYACPPIERLYRDARLNWLEEGPPTIQIAVAAKEFLDGYRLDQ